MSFRKFLFLQGVATPFFRELGKTIRQNGHEVFRVNFCGGDRLFSGNTPSWRFDQPIEALPAWLEQKHLEHNFTDVVLFGDTRPVHVQALRALRDKNLQVHVYEEGYMRPHWITLEQGGVNGYSQLLSKSQDFWQQQQFTLENEPFVVDIGKTFTIRALHDMSYRLASAALTPFFKHYRTHRPFDAHKEYLGWARRFPTNKLWREHQDRRAINRLVSNKHPFYLLPLQLDSDSQIRVHSRFESIQQMIEEVMTSFAQHAPTDSLLVIKNHPLDTGLLKHGKQVKILSGLLGLEDRVIFLESGHLPTLLQHTKGTVLVNSTTGTSALYHGSPTIALGTAIFNLPGLTFQDGLDRFWTEGQPADKDVYRCFRHAVIELTQINGDFYSRKGIQLAIQGSLKAMKVTPLAIAPAASSSPTHSHSRPETAGSEPLLPIPIYGGKMPETSYLYKKH